MIPRTDHPRTPPARLFARAFVGIALIIACPGVVLSAENPDGGPAPAPRLEILDHAGPFDSGARLRGRATALGEGSYRVEWRDADGTLAGRDFAGPGEREFAFELSYPRTRPNELVLSRIEGRRADEVFRLRFGIALPAARSGLLRVLVPEAGAEAPAGFPADAVLWNVAARPEPPDTLGRELVIDLALGDLGGGPPPEVWGRQAVAGGTPSRETRVRVPCLNDPAFRREVREHVRKHLASPGAKSAAAISLGAGLSATCRGAPYDFCTSEHCEGAFRAFLREKYGTPAALARAWDEPVASWDDATALSLEELSFPHATRYAAWNDHLAFRDATFAAFVDFASAQVRTAAPVVPVGFLGLGLPAAYGGADFELLGRAVDWRGSAWRSGARRLAGSFSAPGGALAFASSVSTVDAPRAVSGALAGERLVFLRPGEREASLAFWGGSRGLGRLIEMSAPPPPRPRGSELADAATPRVALVWSQASVRASFIVDSQALGLPWNPGPRAPADTLVPPGVFQGGREGSWALAWEAWCSLLADLGVTFACVSEADVARGDLVAKGFRAAVLVRHMSVSSEAALALERFARSGGVVIADAGAGLFDGRLTRAGPGVLARLFGVEHGAAKFSEVGPKRAAIADRALRYIERPEGPSWFPHAGQLGVGPAQSGLRLTTARAEGKFGDIPCLAVSPFGGGWGVTLNLAVTPYPRLRLAPGGGGALRSLVRGGLARAGVAPAVDVRCPEGTAPPPSAEVRDAAGARLVVVRRDASRRRAAEEVTTHLNLSMDALPAAHDPSTGVSLGWTRHVEVYLAPGEARVISFLRYRLRAILVEPLGHPADAARTGPEAFEVALRREGGGVWAPHVLDIRVEGPDGRAREELGRVLDVAGGRAGFVVPFASSDRPGLWTLRLRDAATGVSAVRRFVRGGRR
ncbi:MAG: beta-galactosidase [Planctomycetota bacterium]|jgi:hypothetical protein